MQNFILFKMASLQFVNCFAKCVFFFSNWIVKKRKRISKLGKSVRRFIQVVDKHNTASTTNYRVLSLWKVLIFQHCSIDKLQCHQNAPLLQLVGVCGSLCTRASVNKALWRPFGRPIHWLHSMFGFQGEKIFLCASGLFSFFSASLTCFRASFTIFPHLFQFFDLYFNFHVAENSCIAKRLFS